VVNGEMSLRRLTLSIYEVVTPREKNGCNVQLYIFKHLGPLIGASEMRENA
jgi:hypothetical protein